MKLRRLGGRIICVKAQSGSDRFTSKQSALQCGLFLIKEQFQSHYARSVKGRVTPKAVLSSGVKSATRIDVNCDRADGIGQM